VNLFSRLSNRRPDRDDQITYTGGATVRRVQRGRRARWYLNGAPVSEREALLYMGDRAASQSERDALTYMGDQATTRRRSA
jgi:hypothetical protein